MDMRWPMTVYKVSIYNWPAELFLQKVGRYCNAIRWERLREKWQVNAVK